MPDAYPLFELPEKAEEVLEIVDQIPEGKVLTYGDVAEPVSYTHLTLPTTERV